MQSMSRLPDTRQTSTHTPEDSSKDPSCEEQSRNPLLFASILKCALDTGLFSLPPNDQDALHLLPKLATHASSINRFLEPLVSEHLRHLFESCQKSLEKQMHAALCTPTPKAPNTSPNPKRNKSNTPSTPKD